MLQCGKTFSEIQDNENEGLKKQELLTTTAQKVGQFRQSFLEERASVALELSHTTPYLQMMLVNLFDHHEDSPW